MHKKTYAKETTHSVVSTAKQSSFFKTIVERLLYSVFVVFLLASSSAANALGLGSFDVQSNLDQPLNGFIELRVASGDDVNSIEAQIASEEDFQKLGVDYPAYMTDISIEVVDWNGSKALAVSSGDVIIKEPFIHFLVRVDWSGGSFLREYTALIDPPAYAAETPNSLAQPRAVGTDQSYQAENEPEIAIEEIDQSDAFDDVSTPEYEEEYVEDDVQEEFVDTDQRETGEFIDTDTLDARYGPVVAGESLSEIAQELQRQFPSLSIYQIMKVIFEENRSAFIRENINGLIKGSVLNLGDLNAIRAVDIAESKQFFYDQVTAWDPSFLEPQSDDSIRVGQDEYDDDDDIFSSGSDSSFDDEAGFEEDSFQVGSSDDTQSFVSATQGDNRDGEVLALQQQISELEASLSSSTLENQELTERISILEGQLADMNRLVSLDVEDADLASVEATLAQQNQQDDTADFIDDDSTLLSSQDQAIEEFLDDQSTVNDELASDSDDFLPLDNELLDDGSLTDLDETIGDELADLGDSSLLDSELVDDGLALDSTLNEDATDSTTSTEDSVLEVAEQEVASSAPVVSKETQSSSFMDRIKSLDTNLWAIAGGAGGVLALLGLFFYRRHRSDQEFEVSMLSIESHSQTLTDLSKETVESISQSKSASVSERPEPDKETSFLTVYSDSDAVVQADEVDPIAEADVYIAYGRDEQAEEVLLDGISANPDRVDIKHKLLSLYHKNENTEGFERVAEELYAQKSVLTAEVWDEVGTMGKELLPNNPMFDVSVDDLLVDEATDAADQSPVEELDEADSDALNLNDQEEGTLDFQVDEGDIDDDSEETIVDIDLSNEDDPSSESTVDFGEEESSINLINFDEGVSELDEVKIDSLDIDNDDGTVEIDLEDVVEVENQDDAESETEDKEDTEYSSTISEVSDLEIDPDYDEARTQYELAKVFVDLGDEEGAKKILKEIVADTNNKDDVLKDANELLESIT